MGRLIPADAIGSPTCWILCFSHQAGSWWASALAMGRLKHVRAMGYALDCDVWVFYDVQLTRTTLEIARGNLAARKMEEWCVDSDVLMMDAAPPTMPAVRPMRLWTRIWCPLLCTTTIASLVGLSPSAWRPDSLYSECLRHGARIPKLTKGESHGLDHHSCERSVTQPKVC